MGTIEVAAGNATPFSPSLLLSYIQYIVFLPVFSTESEPTRVLIDQPPILRLIPNQKHPEIKCKTDGGVPEPTRLEWVIKYGDKMHNNWKFRGRKRNASRFSCRPWEECTLRPTKALVSNDVITCEAENKVIAINGTHETHNVNRSVQIKIVGKYRGVKVRQSVCC